MMGTNSFLALHAPYMELVEKALYAYVDAEGIPDLLKKSMAYSLCAGGKRLRPVMLLAACDMFGGEVKTALPFACAMEMIHTYSLIHDDLPAMDNDDLRRGKPTSHKVFGEGHAILAGDGLLSYAFEIIFEAIIVCAKFQYIEAGRCIVEGAGVRGMVKGQSLDLQQEGKTVFEEKTLLAIHEGKTAAMLKAAVEAGACCADATKEQKKIIAEFGRQFGLLFQITDDILDVEGEEALLGKSTGKDVRDSKLTFPSFYGLMGAKYKAADAAENALRALNRLQCPKAYFEALVAYTLQRKN